MTEWQKEPPTEPGWYWWQKGDYPTRPMEVFRFGKDYRLLGSTHPMPTAVEDMGGEWWPERIKEPE